MGLGLSLGTGQADAAQLTPGHLPVTELGSWLGSLFSGSPHWGATPRQGGGTADGKGHDASTASTRARGGTGHAPGAAPGELPADRDHGRKVTPGPSGVATRGFDAATSRRDAVKSSATMNYFTNADGSVTRDYTRGPVNFADGPWGWRPIDTTVRGGQDGRWHETANSLAVDFAGSAADPALATLTVDAGHAVSYGLQGARAVAPRVDGHAATYPGALAGTDVALEPTATGLKESLVLHAATAPNTWVFPLALDGLTPRLEADGSVSLLDGGGATRQRIPRGYAFDSRVDPVSGEPATTYAIKYELSSAAGKPALKITLDPKWLADPARVFPVTVDPTFTDTPSSTYAEIGAPGDHSMEKVVKIGSFNSGPDSANTFLQFPKDIDGSQVTVSAATLKLFDTWASTCTAERFDVAPVTQTWTPSGVSAYPGPSYGASIGNVTPSVPTACANRAADRTKGDWVSVPLSTATFTGWANGSVADNGLAVYAATNDSLHWKQFDSWQMNAGFQPVLSLTTSGNVPPVVDSAYPGAGGVTTSLVPFLFATAHDIDAGPGALKYRYQVADQAGTTIADSGLVAEGTWRVPAGKLKYNQTYYWAVQAYDGSSYSADPPWNPLTVSVDQPLVTSSLSQNTGVHGVEPSIGNYTTSATDAEVRGVGPALSVVRDYNSRDPRTTGAFGAGWSSVVDARAAEQYDFDGSGTVVSVLVTYPDGSEVGYGKNADGTFSPPAGRFATFKAITGGYSLTDKNDTVYTFTQALGSGVYQLSSIADANGRAVNLTVSGGHPATLTSAVSGRALHLAWTTPAGATSAHVATVSTDELTPGTPLTWTYGYTGDQLTSVCPPGTTTGCTRYGYTAGSPYRTSVLDVGPHSFWPLAEATGTTAASAVLTNEGADAGTYHDVTLGRPGPLAGSAATAAGFNGTSSYLQLPRADAAAPNTMSVSMWFKTAATNGVLFSYSTMPLTETTSPASQYTPALYVGNDGKLVGEYWTGATDKTITTANPVNDNAWHHVVFTHSSTSQGMYLDGQFVGSSIGAIVPMGPQNRYIGAGFLGNAWPDQSHSGQPGTATFFNGQIADVGIWDKSVPGVQEMPLYQAGKQQASLLTSITRPSGAVHTTVSYDPVSQAVTQIGDENGGTWKYAPLTAAGSSQVYRGAVLGSHPELYQRLADAPGTAVPAGEVSYRPSAYTNATLGVTGPFTDSTAAKFPGTVAGVTLPDHVVSASNTASVELWFATTSAAAGMLFSTGNSPLGAANPSTGAMPVLYVGTDGKLHGHFWDNSVAGMASAGKVNDGKWHHVVLSGANTSQALYLDGQQIGTLSAQIFNVDPYAFAGAGVFNTGGWPAAPAGTTWNYFTGSIGELAYYRSALSAGEVAQHFLAAGNSQGLAPLTTSTITDPGGKTSVLQYDPAAGNHKVAETDTAGHRTTYGYDTSGFLHTSTDPNGNVVTVGHDVRGNTVSQTTCQNQAGEKCSTTYSTYFPDDTTPQLTTADARNDLMLTSRDGRSASATDPAYLTTFGYDTAGNRTSVTTPPVPGFPNGRTTAIAYSDGTAAYPASDTGNVPAGLPVKTTSPGGAVNKIAYRHNGDVDSTTNADGLVTRFTYDPLGRVLTKTAVSDSYPAGLVTSYGYDGSDQVVSQTDPAVTDRVTGAVHTAVTTSVYNADGSITSQTVADGTGGDAARTTSSVYNDKDQVASTTDANGNVTTYTYDAYGNKKSETDPNGTETDWTYDGEGRLLTQGFWYTGNPADPQPATFLTQKSNAYDPAGRLAAETDSMGNTTAYTYTDNGLTSTVTRKDPTGQQSFVTESNTYDAAGNLVGAVTGNGANTSASTVDAAGRVSQTVDDPAGAARTTSVSYTPDDKVATSTQSDPSGRSRTVSTTYDPMGVLTSRSLAADGAGHPVGWWKLNQPSGTTVTDSSGTGNTAAASAVTWSGGAATLDGTSSQIATNGPVLNTAAAYTVSAWVNPATLGTAWQTFVVQKGTVMSGLYLEYDGSAHKWSFSRHGTDAANATVYRAESAATAQAGWTHLTGVYDSGTGAMTLYVNGAAAGSTTDPSPMASGGPLVIGHGWAAGVSGNYATGQVGGVQAYSRALSAAEVSTLFTGGRNGGTVASSAAETTTWTVDQRGLPTSMTDANGNVTAYANDEAGNPAVTTAPTVNTETNGGAPVAVHPVTTLGYNSFGEPVESVDPNGNQITTVYDASGRPVSVTNPNYSPPGGGAPITATTVRTYDKIGQVVSEKDPLNHVTGYEFDQLGNLARLTKPSGAKSVSTYDTNGDRLSVTDPNGARTEATYDFLSRPLTSTVFERYPSTLTATTTNSYAASPLNPGGANLASTRTPNGALTSYGYNALGETTSVTDAAGNTTRYGYSYLGEKASITAADNTSTETSYDQSSRPVRVTRKDATGAVLKQTSAAYDAGGRLTSSVDGRGTPRTFTYDAANRLASELQPVSATSSITTTFGYDAAGNRTRFTDGRGNPTITRYNPWNLPEALVEPATAAYTTDADRTSTSVYDAAGRPVTQTQPGGVTVSAGYDDDGNLVSQTGGGADAATASRTFGYDPGGRLTSVATAEAGVTGHSDHQAASSETLGYNDRGELLTASGSAGSSSFAYNTDGLMTTRTDAAGTTSYGYDGADRLSSITDAATGGAQTLSYNALNQVSGVTYGTGNTRTFGYDGLHRLTGDTLKTAGGAAIASVGYGYDGNDNLTSKTTAGFAGAAANTYTYDLADRLASWNNGVSTVAYGYDAAGNRTQVGSSTYTYDARNELTSDGSNTYTYSARGTLRERASSTSSLVSSSDAFGQMIVQGSQNFGYDGLGRNLTDTTIASGATTTFAFSGLGNAIASDGTSTYSRDPGGGLVGIASGGTGAFAFVDQHTDVVGTFTATGSALAGSSTYDPFGNVLASANVKGQLGYQSGWTDRSTGNVNMAARWYNPAVGQFMNRDTVSNSPVPNPMEANKFAYVDDNPMTGTDPSGHGWFSDAWSFVSNHVVQPAASFVYHQVIQPAAHFVNTYVVQPIVHVAVATYHVVRDAYHAAARVVRTVYHHVVRAVKKVYHAAVHVVKTAYHAVAKAVKTAAHAVVHAAAAVGHAVASAAKSVGHAVATAATAVGHAAASAASHVATFVKDHASTIAGIAAGVIVGAACTAATLGIGAVGCAAIGGAVGGAVSYGMDCSKAHNCSVGGAVEAVGLGALGGALGAGLAGPLGGRLVSEALDGVLPQAATQGLIGAGSGAVSGGVTALAGYGLNCGRDCSVGGALSAAGSGALAGGAGGAAFGALGGLRARGRSSAEEPAACPVHSFLASTKVLLADGSAKPISSVQVGDRISNSQPGKVGIESHPVDRVIKTETDHDFVNVKVKPLRRALGRAAVGLAVSAAVVTGAAAPASAAPATLTTTFHHPFFDVTRGAFVEAVNLQPGDHLQTADGGEATVEEVVPYHSTEVTYDLTIDRLHTYYVYAGGTPVLVHNCGGYDPEVEGLNDAAYDGLRASHGDKVADGVDYQVKRMHDGSDTAADHEIPGIGHDPQRLADYFQGWVNRTTHVDAKTGARIGYDTSLNVLIVDTADKIHGYQLSPEKFATATTRPGGPPRYVLP
ncbi:LamG domain-containing protein [Amycolatopsis sp. FBCC-B4732]|uniref:LamG-like jellyroll fold domain-containing protein n=1 Tax=Amycolatopsis sp. FBCC-B4732 TaxID=3079339 RepID=UPI001FF4535F|nr:LamG-like jellyroll fold domain-containing protein [Amycolatopsis sp. FBCC-B4732]UOX90824.1 LamG domain-containing protein [Amycolatopsis sp. FBCC-B4732]